MAWACGSTPATPLWLAHRGDFRAAPEAATPQARATVEMLAGMPFEYLWGNNNVGYLNRNNPPAPALEKKIQLNSTFNRG